MTKPLLERFASAKEVLDKAVAAVAPPARLPIAVTNQFRELARCRAEIDRWSDMLEARGLLGFGASVRRL